MATKPRKTPPKPAADAGRCPGLLPVPARRPWRASPRRSGEQRRSGWPPISCIWALLLGALALAYLPPFELLVLSYTILGPAHYLTEISWLHDRKYFLPHRACTLLALAALGAMFMADQFWLGALIAGCFVVCALLAAVRAAWGRPGVPGHRRRLLCAAEPADVPFGFVWVLLPTVIHVSVFTLIFMTVGAFKSRSAAQFGMVGIYLAAIALILLLPPSQGRSFLCWRRSGETISAISHRRSAPSWGCRI